MQIAGFGLGFGANAHKQVHVTGAFDGSPGILEHQQEVFMAHKLALVIAEFLPVRRCPEE